MERYSVRLVVSGMRHGTAVRERYGRAAHRLCSRRVHCGDITAGTAAVGGGLHCAHCTDTAQRHRAILSCRASQRTTVTDSQFSALQQPR